MLILLHHGLFPENCFPSYFYYTVHCESIRRLESNIYPGAGGKGGESLTYAIDRDAATHFIRASVNTPSVNTFLLVSALSSRRNKASWWDDASWSLVQKINSEIMPHYYAAKLAADEALTVLGEKRREKDGDFRYLILRPGQLSDDPEVGKVSLGRTAARGSISRADVAGVADALLAEKKANGWFDLLGGEEKIEEAVERVVKSGANDIEGEDTKVMEDNLIQY